MAAEIVFKRLSSAAFVPTRDETKPFCWSIHSAFDYLMRGHEVKTVETKLQLRFSPDCYGQLTTCPSAAEKGIEVISTTVPTECDRLTVTLRNTNKEAWNLRAGTDIAHLTVVRQFPVELVEEVDDLEEVPPPPPLESPPPLPPLPSPVPWPPLPSKPLPAYETIVMAVAENRSRSPSPRPGPSCRDPHLLKRLREGIARRAKKNKNYNDDDYYDDLL